LQQQPHLLHTEGLLDVVVGPQFHRVHGRFDRSVPRHDGHFRARQHRLDLFQQFHARLVRQLQVRQHQVRRIRLQPLNRCLRALRLVAVVGQRTANRHAQPADALLIVHNQKFNSQIVAHGFPNVVSTMEISSWTRNGFSMQGVVLFANKSCVSLFAVSPLIRMILPLSSGRFARIHWCTSAPLIFPGIRISVITPAYVPLASCRKPSSPLAACTTVYPRLSRAARTKALTEVSSSIRRIGENARTVVGELIAPPHSPPRPAMSPSLAANAPGTCSRFPRHSSSREFLRHARARSRSRCSIPVPSPSRPAWS